MTSVLIAGAGPAGLSAAVAALAAGATVTLVDAAPRLGGQFWRHPAAARSDLGEAALQHDWARFERLRAEVTRHLRCQLRTGTQIWAVEQAKRGLRWHLASGAADGPDRTLDAIEPDAVVLATGAHDRTLPFPGWDLPGVVTGGAAQALAKSDRIAIGRRVVVAGSGPFLLPVAASLTAVGATVIAVHEAAGPAQIARGWRAAGPVIARMPHKITELAGYAAGQLRGRIPYIPGSAVVAAHGDARLQAVTSARLDSSWSPVPGTERTVEADALAVTHTFTPRLELAIAAGCALRPDAVDGGRFVAVDDCQRTSVPSVLAAGELTGIGGADAARHAGALAGWVAAGGDPADARARAARRRISADRRFQQALAAAHAIRPGWTGWLRHDTVICRCEEVCYGTLRETLAATGAQALRSVKLTTRAALGPCQGRICGRTVEYLASRVVPLLDDASTDRRPFAAPLRLRELAALPDPVRKADR